MPDKPSYRLAHAARKGESSMQVEGAVDATEPKTSFMDKNLDPRDEPGDPVQRITGETAKSGGSISANPNAPKQTSRGAGSTKPNDEGLTRT